MPAITVRISEEEKKRLLRHGPVSQTVRRGLQLVEEERKREEFARRLVKFQKEHPVKLSSDEIVRIIREDRSSR